MSNVLLSGAWRVQASLVFRAVPGLKVRQQALGTLGSKGHGCAAQPLHINHVRHHNIAPHYSYIVTLASSPSSISLFQRSIVIDRSACGWVVDTLSAGPPVYTCAATAAAVAALIRVRSIFSCSLFIL